jgi:hypothetical protein
MHARYYNNFTGRFLSPDIAYGQFDVPQSLNRYTYGGNNPIKYLDPNGLEAVNFNKLSPESQALYTKLVQQVQAYQPAAQLESAVKYNLIDRTREAPVRFLGQELSGQFQPRWWGLGTPDLALYPKSVRDASTTRTAGVLVHELVHSSTSSEGKAYAAQAAFYANAGEKAGLSTITSNMLGQGQALSGSEAKQLNEAVGGALLDAYNAFQKAAEAGKKAQMQKAMEQYQQELVNVGEEAIQKALEEAL